MRAEVLHLTPTAYREDERGDDVPCRWVITVAVGDALYLVDVHHQNGAYEVTGWHEAEDDERAPARVVAALDQDALSEIDDFMRRGGRG
jgi:hypothetical protein